MSPRSMTIYIQPLQFCIRNAFPSPFWRQPLLTPRAVRNWSNNISHRLGLSRAHGDGRRPVAPPHLGQKAHTRPGWRDSVPPARLTMQGKRFSSDAPSGGRDVPHATASCSRQPAWPVVHYAPLSPHRLAHRRYRGRSVYPAPLGVRGLDLETFPAP